MGRGSTAASCSVKTPGEGGQVRLKNEENSDPSANFSSKALMAAECSQHLVAEAQKAHEASPGEHESSPTYLPAQQGKG